MKHILNDLTEQEKNSIREQHTGGMKVMTENFNKLINSKLGDSKPLVNEALGGSAPQRTQSTTTTFTPGNTVELGSNLFKIGTDKINTNSNEFKNALSMIRKSGANGITVQGGASSAGSPKYDNQSLADRRAYNFKNALINAGIKDIGINVVKGIVTPNTDIPNSPEANNAQFVRITHTTSPSLNTQSVSAIDNATTILPFEKTKFKTGDKDKTGNYKIDVRVTFPKTMSSSKILESIKTALRGVAIKVERIDKPLFEQKEEENESFWGDMFGKPSIDRATHDSLRGQGYSQRGRDDEDEHYVMFNGEKFYDDDIEYADYNDLGKLPRIEDGKLIVTNPAWEL
jgi:outer membrane protein OmpA-like peptidoglycan-associated protein